MCHLACSASDFPHPSRSSSLLLAEVRKGWIAWLPWNCAHFTLRGLFFMFARHVPGHFASVLQQGLTYPADC